MSRDLFREGMGRVCSAVHIIATAGPAGLTGLTASAVMSLSDNPPSLIVAVNHSGQSAECLKENSCFSVNTLCESENDLADVFAGRTGLRASERFAHGEWDKLETGCPILRSSLVSFDCKLMDARNIATHCVMIGEIVGIHLGETRSPLLYQSRAYRVLARDNCALAVA